MRRARSGIAPVGAIAVILAASTGCAHSHRQELDSLCKQFVDAGWSPGLVIGVYDRGQQEVVGCGKAGEGLGAPNGRTLFELGSVTKPFTALALALLVEEKKASLEEPVEALLADGSRVPANDGPRVTLVQLATHSSGLPLMPRVESGAPDESDLSQVLATAENWQPAHAAGTWYEYSNLGFAILGHGLSKRAGVSFATLLSSRILEPLGMRDSTLMVQPGGEAQAQAQGSADGAPVPHWSFSGMAPAEGMRSTGEDLLKFVRANIDPPKGALGRAIDATQERRLTNPDGLGITLGWQTGRRSAPDDPLLSHGGQTNGFDAWVGFDRRGRRGAVVLANAAVVRAADVGLAALEIARGKPARLELPMAVSLPREQLQRVVGDYQYGPDRTLQIRLEEDHLVSQVTGELPQRLYPASPNQFFAHRSEMPIIVETGSTGQVVGLLIRWPWRDLFAKRRPVGIPP